LGCDGSSLAPLQIKTIPDLNIQISTSDIERFRLLPDNTYTVGSSTVIADGFSLHCPDVAAFYAAGAPGPFSLEHLAAPIENGFQDAYRDWAKTGTTYTGGKSMAYVGLKDSDDEHKDLAIQVAKRDGTPAPDRIRFLFTDLLNGSSASGADSQEGLEGMRLTAMNNDEVNVGIGDFGVAGGEPTERLDVLKGKVRLRSMPTDPVSTSDEVVTVNMTTGVLEHRPFPTATSCDWKLDGTAMKMTTAYRTSVSASECTDRQWKMGIGTDYPGSKVDIYHDDAFTNVGSAVNVTYRSDNDTPFATGLAIDAMTSPTSGTLGPALMYGVRGGAISARNIGYGIFGEASGSGVDVPVLEVHGVRGRMTPAVGTTSFGYGVSGIVSPGNGVATNAYGVHGNAATGTNRYSIFGALPSGGTVNWSCFFVGPISAAGVAFPSDLNLKTGIQELDGAMDLLMQFHPKSYQYRLEEYPQMGLPEGQRYGFIAQEVQEDFPQFVKQSHQPEQVDSLGNELFPAVDFLALSTADIIPILVGAVQQQQQMQTEALAAQTAELDEMRDQLQAQQTRLDQLEQLLTDCCNRPAGDGLRQGGTNNIPNMNVTEGDRTLRIVPNPMQDQATIHYQLERSGRMQLLVNSNDGKELRVLKEANTEAGIYQYAWATEGLAPGVYYVTLLLDGQPITKQVIKIDR